MSTIYIDFSNEGCKMVPQSGIAGVAQEYIA